MAKPERIKSEGKADEFEYAIIYEIKDERNCSVRWGKNATKALKKFEKENGEFRLIDIHKV